MKKQYFFALFTAAALGILGLSGCSQQSGANASDTSGGDLLSQIQERGEIVVATEGTWAPWTYHDESGALVGYDVEVMELRIIKLLRMLLKIVPLRKQMLD